MAWDGKSQLHITPWPDKPLPSPPALQAPSQLDATGTVIYPVFTQPGLGYEKRERIELSGETYLRLGDVDLGDADSILAFVNSYGALGGLVAYRDVLGDGDPRSALLYETQLDWRAELVKKKRVLREEMRDLPDWIPEVERRQWRSVRSRTLLSELPPVVETLEEFRFAARLIRDIKTAWVVLRDGLDPESVEWVSEPQRREEMQAADRLLAAMGRPPRAQFIGKTIQPSYLLTTVLERLLHWFSPRVGMSWTFSPPAPDVSILFEPPTETTVEPKPGPDTAPLYAICALELFNHIIDNTEYHTCANERCRRTFVHQQGGSKKGQRRSRGVIYCTPECARATAQREYRRRRRRDTPR